MNEWEWHLLEDRKPVDVVRIQGSELKKGDRVRLRPGRGGDIMDLAFDGHTAVIEAIEQDYEGELHLSVVLDDDPGADLGAARQPGHRFFFRPQEVELAEPSARARILIAGIGNIFLGDDGFGVEVAQRLAGTALPRGVRVTDFGIRGYDLAYALTSGYDAAILVDAAPRGGPPGTLYLMEPDLAALKEAANTPTDAHTMEPLSVLRTAMHFGELPQRLLILGCEPGTPGGEDGRMGLSEPVTAAVDLAVARLQSLLSDMV